MSTEYLILLKVIDKGVNGSAIPFFLVSTPVISPLPVFVLLVTQIQQCMSLYCILWESLLTIGRWILSICSKKPQLYIFSSTVGMLLPQFLFRNNILSLSKSCSSKKDVSTSIRCLLWVNQCILWLRRYSRSSKSRNTTKSMLKSMMYPSKAPTPIQYQFGSTKMPREFKTCTPSVSLLTVRSTTCQKIDICL